MPCRRRRARRNCSRRSGPERRGARLGCSSVRAIELPLSPRSFNTLFAIRASRSSFPAITGSQPLVTAWPIQATRHVTLRVAPARKTSCRLTEAHVAADLADRVVAAAVAAKVEDVAVQRLLDGIGDSVRVSHHQRSDCGISKPQSGGSLFGAAEHDHRATRAHAAVSNSVPPGQSAREFSDSCNSARQGEAKHRSLTR